MEKFQRAGSEDAELAASRWDKCISCLDEAIEALGEAAEYLQKAADKCKEFKEEICLN